MAMEDAIVLAKCLRDVPDERRYGRVRRIPGYTDHII